MRLVNADVCADGVQPVRLLGVRPCRGAIRLEDISLSIPRADGSAGIEPPIGERFDAESALLADIERWAAPPPREAEQKLSSAQLNDTCTSTSDSDTRESAPTPRLKAKKVVQDARQAASASASSQAAAPAEGALGWKVCATIV